MTHLVCLLEEPSAGEMLKELFKRLLPPHVHPVIIPFEGKRDLDRQLERKLRGWNRPDSVFLVLRDQDAGDCVAIKNGLLEKIRRTGKQSCTLVRISCHELESFYLGDMQAVETGLGIHGLARQQNKAKYRNPDALGNPSEELMKLTGGKYQKLSGSRAIAPYLDLENNRSHSFNVLIAGLRRFVTI
jgi:hypothetical protein